MNVCACVSVHTRVRVEVWKCLWGGGGVSQEARAIVPSAPAPHFQRSAASAQGVGSGARMHPIVGNVGFSGVLAAQAGAAGPWDDSSVPPAFPG